MNYGNVYQDKKSLHWYIQLRWDNKTERFYQFEYKDKWLPFESKGMAEHTLSLMRNEIKDNCFNPKTWRKDSPLGISEFSKIWLDTSDACKNTKKGYRNAIKHVIEAVDQDGQILFGKDFDIRKFNHSKLVLLKKHLENDLHLSNDAVYNIMGALKTMLNSYRKDVQTYILPVFPPMSKTERENQEYLTYEEQQKVLQAIPERHRPIFIVMMEYGIRPQEATALKWDCVDFEKNEITFKRRHSEYELRETTKTGTRGIRTEQITTRAKEYLQLAKGYCPFKGFVFSHNRLGSHYDNKLLNKIWRTACKEVGLKIGLYEGVRHSWGCQLMDIPGVTIDMVQDGYRHTSAKTTRRYAHRKRSVIADLIEKRGQVVKFEKVKNE